MSNVHNFVLLCSVGESPPSLERLLYANELPTSGPRWFLMSRDAHGDGKAMEATIWGLVINGRDPELVIELVSEHAWEGEGATLMVKRQDDEVWRPAVSRTM